MAPACGRRTQNLRNVLAATTLALPANDTSTRVIIPKDMLNRVEVERGATPHLGDTPRGFLPTPYDPAMARQPEADREFVEDYRDDLRGPGRKKRAPVRIDDVATLALVP
jgi:hypothetical protein